MREDKELRVSIFYKLVIHEFYSHIGRNAEINIHQKMTL